MNAAPDADHEKPRLSVKGRTIAVVLWPSFLAACIATMVFFAIFDPLLMAKDDAPPAWLMDRTSGYTLGFFFFWFVAASASALTAVLLNARLGEAPDAEPPQ